MLCHYFEMGLLELINDTSFHVMFLLHNYFHHLQCRDQDEVDVGPYEKAKLQKYISAQLICNT